MIRPSVAALHLMLIVALVVTGLTATAFAHGVLSMAPELVPAEAVPVLTAQGIPLSSYPEVLPRKAP